MHFTGTIWRPPYEERSLLLEVTAGCTHHQCKFCTLYNDLPFRFKMSSLDTIEADLRQAQMLYYSPQRAKADKLFGRVEKDNCRVFLTGANPFVLSYARLKRIAELIHTYFPSTKSIGAFARITDVTPKTDRELRSLREMGYDGMTIGIETADDEALKFMRKGYGSNDILEQCSRLDAAGISYSFFYLAGISGAGRGQIGAELTAGVCNQLHPGLIGANMLTVYQDSELYTEIQRGRWQESGELEKYREVRTLLAHLRIHTVFAAMGASNAYQLFGYLPQDKEKLIGSLDKLIENVSEEQLQKYRRSVYHL